MTGYLSNTVSILTFFFTLSPLTVKVILSLLLTAPEANVHLPPSHTHTHTGGGLVKIKARYPSLGQKILFSVQKVNGLNKMFC